MNSPRYKPARNPANGKWYTVGLVSGKRDRKAIYMQVDGPFDSEIEAQKRCERQRLIDISDLNELLSV